MPEVDGVAATRSILAALPRTRVLVLTTFASEADAVRTLEAGATGYILKDALPDEIVSALRDVAAGKPAFAPSVAAVVLQRMRAGPAETLTARELEIPIASACRRATASPGLRSRTSAVRRRGSISSSARSEGGEIDPGGVAKSVGSARAVALWSRFHHAGLSA